MLTKKLLIKYNKAAQGWLFYDKNKATICQIIFCCYRCSYHWLKIKLMTLLI